MGLGRRKGHEVTHDRFCKNYVMCPVNRRRLVSDEWLVEAFAIEAELPLTR